MWEKTKLHTNYATALAQITEALQYWPNFNVHKCKQRLTKIHQVRGAKQSKFGCMIGSTVPVR